MIKHGGQDRSMLVLCSVHVLLFSVFDINPTTVVLGKLKLSVSSVCGPTRKMGLQTNVSESVVINEIWKHQMCIFDE